MHYTEFEETLSHRGIWVKLLTTDSYRYYFKLFTFKNTE